MTQDITCRTCDTTFAIDAHDKAFYEKMQVPAPTRCPQCRMRRRLMFKNDRVLYKRTCDATGREILSTSRPGSPYKVYDMDYWHSDA